MNKQILTVQVNKNPDAKYEGPGVYLCYGATHSSYVWAKTFKEAARKTMTADISPMIVSLVREDTTHLVTNAEDQEMFKDKHNQQYWVAVTHSGNIVFNGSRFSFVKAVQQYFSSEEVLFIVDSLEQAHKDKNFKENLSRIKDQL